MSTSNNPVDNWTNYDPIAFPSKDVRQFHKPPAIFQGDDMIVTDTNVLVLLEAKVIKTSTKSLDGDDEDVISESYTTSVVHLKKDSASDISKIRNKVGLITDQQTKYFKCTKCSDSFDDKKLKYQCKFCKDVICGSCSLGVLESQYELEQFERYGYRVCKSCGPHPKLQDYLAAEQGKLDSHLNAMKVFAEQEEAARNTRMKEDQAKYDATMKCYSHTAFRRPPVDKNPTVFPDGEYEGNMENGKRQGWGKMTYKNSEVVSYVGEWFNDKWHGRGIRVKTDGRRYDGSFVDGQLSGRGINTWPNGERYEGMWEAEKQNGYGVYTWADGKKYEGELVYGRRQGRGVFTWPDGARYEGEWDNDIEHGLGIRIWPDGRRYEGEFKYGKANGKGVSVWPNGNRYEGEFKDDMQNGIGTLTHPDRSLYKGDWVDDQEHGRGVRFWNDGKRFEGLFENGKEKEGEGFYVYVDTSSQDTGDWSAM